MKTPQKLGLFMLIALVSGNMIGSGVFLLPANMAALGAVSLWSWVLTGVGALALAMVFAKMSTLVPKAGGPYAFARHSFGEFIGFQTAFNYWVALWVGNAAIAVALIGYLAFFFPILDKPMWTCVSSIAILWIITIFNMIGVRKAGGLQLITTILKLLPLLLVIFAGWFYFHPVYLTHYANMTHHSNFSVISMGAVLTLWAFIGLESATVPSDEVINPKRNVPLATLIGILIAAFVFIASSVIIMGMIKAPILAHSTSPFADAAKMILGSWGGDLIAVGAIISCLGALNGWVLLQGQVAKAAADRGQFPKIFAKRNRFNSVGWGQFITSCLISLLLLMTADDGLIQQFQTIILLAVFMTAIPYFYTAISQLITIKQANPPIKHARGNAVIAIIATIYVLFAIMSTNNKIIYGGIIVLLLSGILYLWVKPQHNESQAGTTKTP